MANAIAFWWNTLLWYQYFPSSGLTLPSKEILSTSFPVSENTKWMWFVLTPVLCIFHQHKYALQQKAMNAYFPMRPANVWSTNSTWLLTLLCCLLSFGGRTLQTVEWCDLDSVEYFIHTNGRIANILIEYSVCALLTLKRSWRDNFQTVYFMIIPRINWK